MKRILVLFLSLTLLMLSGCWDLLIIEDLALALAMGIDQHPEDPEKFIFTVTNPTFSETAVDETRKIAVEAYSLANAFFNAQQQRNRLLVLGQVSTILFSEEAARSGLMHEVMRQVDQQRDMNPNVKIVVVQGSSAQEALYLEPVEEARVAQHLNDLLEQNFNSGFMPRITGSRYWFRYSTPGLDPVVPVIELTGGEEKKGIQIVGLGAFCPDGKLGGVLSNQQAVVGMLLSGQHRRTRIFSQLNIGGVRRKTSYFVKNAKSRVDTEIVNNRAKIAIQLDLAVDVVNIDWGVEVLDRNVEEVIETALANEIQGTLKNKIVTIKNWGADSLGLGQYVRIQNHKWFEQIDWNEEFGKSDIAVQVNVSVKRIGTLIKPNY